MICCHTSRATQRQRRQQLRQQRLQQQRWRLSPMTRTAPTSAAARPILMALALLVAAIIRCTGALELGKRRDYHADMTHARACATETYPFEWPDHTHTTTTHTHQLHLYFHLAIHSSPRILRRPPPSHPILIRHRRRRSGTKRHTHFKHFIHSVVRVRIQAQKNTLASPRRLHNLTTPHIQKTRTNERSEIAMAFAIQKYRVL